MTTVIIERFLQTGSAKCENILLRNLGELTIKIKSLRWSKRMNEAVECYSKRKTKWKLTIKLLLGWKR